MKISVCIPTYNGERYIKEQLESILIQLNDQDEVIISDDHSMDATIKIVEEFHDERIKLVYHSRINKIKFVGSYKNINKVYKNVENALLHATGDVIFLSDQDDIWLPQKVETVMRLIENGADCVLHNNTVIDNEHNILLDSYFSHSKPSRSLIRFIIRNYYQGASMAFTKKISDLSLPFPNYCQISHDHWIACIAWTHGKKIAFVDKPLLLYRRHGNNVSSSSERSRNSPSFKISYRFNLLFLYIKALFVK